MGSVTADRSALSPRVTQSAFIYATARHVSAEQGQHSISARRIRKNGSVSKASAEYTSARLIPGIASAFTSARPAVARLIGRGIAILPSAG